MSDRTSRSSPIVDEEDAASCGVTVVDGNHPAQNADSASDNERQRQGESFRDSVHRAVVADPELEHNINSGNNDIKRSDRNVSPSRCSQPVKTAASTNAAQSVPPASLASSSSSPSPPATRKKQSVPTSASSSSSPPATKRAAAAAVARTTLAASSSASASLSPPSPSPLRYSNMHPNRGAASTAATHGGAAPVGPTPSVAAAPTATIAATASSSEIQTLLLEKVAECQYKDDLIRAMQRMAESLESGLSERVEFCDRLQATQSALERELEEAQASLRRERVARKAAEGELSAARESQAELSKQVASVNEALVCFRVPHAGAAAGGGVNNSGTPLARRRKALASSSPGNTSNNNNSDTSDGNNVARDVAALGRAFMALQLDVLRTFTWAAGLLWTQYSAQRQAIAGELEAQARLAILCQMETSARALLVTSAEAAGRDRIQRKCTSQQHLAAVSESFIFSHERLYSRLLLELSARHFAEWTNLSALQMEAMRRAAAVRLRQSNALLGRAREETEERNKLLEESRRTMNLLKARVDATSKERAAVAAAAVKRKQVADPLSVDGIPPRQQLQPKQQQLLQLQRHEVPTASSSSKTKMQQLYTVVDSPTPAAASSASSSRTPPPPLIPAARKISFDQHPSAVAAAAAAPPAAANNNNNCNSGTSTGSDPLVLARMAEAKRQLQQLQHKMLQMEELLEEKDSVILGLKTDRNVLTLECESLAGQCRLLDQVARYGAKAAVALRTQLSRQ